MSRLPLYEYAGNRCISCHKSVREILARYGTVDRVFAFHHVDPDGKSPNYENIIRRKLSTEQLDEVDKCMLLCVGCHGVVHAQNQRVKLELRSEAGGIEAQQSLGGWMISDHVERSHSILTAEPVHIIPFWVAVGAQQPEVRFGTDFRKVDAIRDYLRMAADGSAVEIRSWESRKLLFAARRHRAGSVRLQQHVAFNFLTMELTTTDGKQVWLRNGRMLADDGSVSTSGVLTAVVRL